MQFNFIQIQINNSDVKFTLSMDKIVIRFPFIVSTHTKKNRTRSDTVGDDQSQHYPLHSQNPHHQRPPSEHIYFSIESDYNSTNAGHEFINSSGTSTGPTAAQNIIALNAQQNSMHRPSIGAQQWRLTSNHKNSSSSTSSSPQPHMV